MDASSYDIKDIQTICFLFKYIRIKLVGFIISSLTADIIFFLFCNRKSIVMQQRKGVFRLDDNLFAQLAKSLSVCELLYGNSVI